MSSSQKNNSKRLSLYRKQRAQQHEQIKNSLRFSNQFDLYLKMTSESDLQTQPLSQQRLVDILRNENIEGLNFAIIGSCLDGSQLLEKYVIEVVSLLKNHLNNPLALLSLGNLINCSQLYCQTVLVSDCFQKLINYLSKLAPGSKSQDLYLWILCAVTDRPFRLNQKQETLLLTIVQQILAIKLDKDEENPFLIRLVKNLAESDITLSQDLTVAFSNLFWIIQNQISKLNIYLTCSRLIQSRLYHRSTQVLMHLFAVCLRGRSHFDKEEINIELMLPSVYSLLICGFESYNQNWELMETSCKLKIQDQAMTLGLHQFLLTFESSFFSRKQTEGDYYIFLKLFCQYAPIELLVERWFQLGTFHYLIQSLPEYAVLILEILKLICWRIYEETQRSWLLERLKMETSLKERIEEVLFEEHNQQIVKNCIDILNILEMSYK